MSFRSKSPSPEVQPPAPPAPTEQTPVDLTPARISHEVDNNGYLDPDQTIVNFAIREVGITFEQLIKQDPSRLLREWRGEYRKSKSASLLSLGLGATGVICGVFTGATPLLMAGVAIAAVAGFTTKHFSSGAESRDIELELIDKLHPVLQLLDQLERRGVNPSALVSIYDTIARAAFANPNLATISPSHLKELFETELKRSEVLKQFAQQPTGLSAVTPAMPSPPPAPALPSTSPVGAQTRLTAIDVPAPVSASVPTPIVDQGVVIPVNHVADFWADDSDIFQTASPTTPHQSLWQPPQGLSLKDRAIAVIQWLDQAGFPIGRLMHSDYVFAYGASQSGKSTILHLVSILETALQTKVIYINPDGDYPNAKYYKMGGVGVDNAIGHWQQITKGIENSPADRLLGVSFWLDEMWQVAQKTLESSGVSPITGGLIVAALSKSSKTGAKIRIASQNATQGSNGLKNCWELFNLSFVKVQALKSQATSTEPERALGQYRVCFPGQKPETWTLPNELKQVTGRRGNPDPVAALLSWLPELVGLNEQHPPVQPRSHPQPIAQPIPQYQTVQPTIEDEEQFTNSESSMDFGSDDEIDPAIELISDEPNPEKREALMIAYQWARGRLDRGGDISRESFGERVRKDRKCDYLKNNRDEIWDELQGLI